MLECKPSVQQSERNFVKILLTGADGLIGKYLVSEMRKRDISHAALTRSELDICDNASSLDALRDTRPDVVINAAALCSFDACQRDPAASAKTNRDAPAWWATMCNERGIRFIHFSSDYVFDGLSATPYTEQDATHPLCVYGEHKAATEHLLADMPNVLLLRVAWLFGIHGRTFMSMLPGLLMGQTELTIAAGKKGSCLHAALGARAVLDLIEKQTTGLVNLVHRGTASWEEFAAYALASLVSRGCEPACKSLRPVPFKKLLDGKGARPDYSVLDPSHAENLLGYRLAHWTEGLEAYLDELGFAPRP